MHDTMKHTLVGAARRPRSITPMRDNCKTEYMATISESPPFPARLRCRERPSQRSHLLNNFLGSLVSTLILGSSQSKQATNRKSAKKSFIRATAGLLLGASTVMLSCVRTKNAPQRSHFIKQPAIGQARTDCGKPREPRPPTSRATRPEQRPGRAPPSSSPQTLRLRRGHAC